MNSERRAASCTAASIVIVAFGAVVWFGVGPAVAFTADGTATLAATSVDASQEYAATTLSGECPAGTVSASIAWNWTTTGGPRTASSAASLNGADGTFSDDFYLYNSALPDAPGTTYTFELACSDGATTIAAASQVYVVPDFGQTVSVPSNVAVGDDVVASVDCGTGTADTLYVTAYVEDTQIFSDWIAYTGPGSYSLGAPGLMGFAAGDTADLSIMCQATHPSTHGASYRLVSFAAVAAAPSAPTDAPPSAADPSLADTGTSPAGTSALGVLLTMTGFGVAIARRRRAATAVG